MAGCFFEILQRSTSHYSYSNTISSRVALIALALIFALAFVPSSSLVSDRTGLLAISLICAVFCWTPVQKHVLEKPERALFLLCVAMFMAYGLARSAGPETGFSLRFAALPDDEFIVPYSAYVVVLGAVFSSTLWWNHTSTWTRSLLGSSVILIFFTLLSFWILKQHFPVGPLEILDPTPLPRMAMNLVEYSCLALCCHAVTAQTETRRIALRFLPGVLLLLWARHQFLVTPEDSE